MATAEKTRALKLQRLQTMIDRGLDHPLAALETLVSELSAGEARPELWEGLHAAAARDGKEPDLAAGYQKVATERRLRQLPPDAQGALLLHAADFTLGALGDRAGADRLLQRVLEVDPTHLEAFSRLERRFELSGEKLLLAQLYATVAHAPPKPADDLARRALNLIAQLPAKTPLPDAACLRLVALASASLRLLDVLDAHCRKTERHALAAALRERAIEELGLPEATVVEQRHQLLELYVGGAADPEKAVVHVEELLGRNPSDRKAQAAAEQLLGNRKVASRAAAALQEARRRGRSPA